jgi:hypothetical protein
MLKDGGDNKRNIRKKGEKKENGGVCRGWLRGLKSI